MTVINLSLIGFCVIISARSNAFPRRDRSARRRNVAVAFFTRFGTGRQFLYVYTASVGSFPSITRTAARRNGHGKRRFRFELSVRVEVRVCNTHVCPTVCDGSSFREGHNYYLNSYTHAHTRSRNVRATYTRKRKV